MQHPCHWVISNATLLLRYKGPAIRKILKTHWKWTYLFHVVDFIFIPETGPGITMMFKIFSHYMYIIICMNYFSPDTCVSWWNNWWRAPYLISYYSKVIFFQTSELQVPLYPYIYFSWSDDFVGSIDDGQNAWTCNNLASPKLNLPNKWIHVDVQQ